MNRKKIAQIVQNMTLQEKASLCSGLDFWHTKGVERLGVPSLTMSDGPHGLRKQEGSGDHLGLYDSVTSVCYPAACATASSFDPQLLRALGETLGDECADQGVDVLLGPALNIKRSPLGGRNFEYFSEDPYLTGELSAAFVQGVQSRGIAACPKHFAANNQECRRMTVSAEMDERTLREMYLPGFETTVKRASPWTMMCSYNRINGVYSSENARLLSDILRREWGFDGLVVSDWYATCDRVKGVEAGLDLEMPGGSGENDKKIVEAVRDGTLNEALLDAAAENILTVVFRCAEGRKQSSVSANMADAQEVNSAGADGRALQEIGHARAVDFACESAVLLKNEGVLPLQKGEAAAFIGCFAKNPRYQGGGSSHINAYRVTGACEAAAESGARYERGFGEEDETLDETAAARAVELARACGRAVVFAGLPESYESEGYDRPHMRLPAAQNELIARVAAAADTVVVLHNGSPVEMPWISSVKAVLELYLGGEGVGEAAVRLLYGDANPCGRLAETFPVRLEDNPSYLDFPGAGDRVEYREGVFVGYRYYASRRAEVLFPFGHGLSYTRFSYSDLRLSSENISDTDTLTVSVDVTNTGSRPGKEAVQLYVRDGTGAAVRPVRELKGFIKLSLDPGETKTAVFTLDKRAFAWFNPAIGDFYAASGRYDVMIGKSASDIVLTASVTLTSAMRVPFTVDGNTTIERLLACEKTRDIIRELFGKALKKDNPDTKANAGMMQAAYMQAPLRTARLLLRYDDAQFDALLSRLNAALNE